jgi:hypothetical protein
VDYAQGLLASDQQRLPDVINKALKHAIEDWDSKKQDHSIQYFKEALRLAGQHQYL